MDLKNLDRLDCPQFVNFDSPGFLCAEITSLSLDGPNLCDSVKKSMRKFVKDDTIENKEKVQPCFQKAESDDKENKKSKTNTKYAEDKSAVGVKRKRIVESDKKALHYQRTFIRSNLNPLKQLQPILSAQSPQLPVKRRRLATALEAKSPCKKLPVKTPKPVSQAPYLKAPVPNIQNALRSKVPVLKAAENFKFKARPVPDFMLKRQGPKEVKADLKVQKPPSAKLVNVKRGTDLQPFRFDQCDKEKILQKEKNLKALNDEKKVFGFSSQSNPKAGQIARPCVSSKLPSKPEPFRFGLDKDSKNSFKDCRAFKARPATVLKSKPFAPKTPPKSKIEVQEFKLHTQQRADERHRKQLADRDRLKRQPVNFMEKLKMERAEILRKRREIFERYNIKINKPLESKQATVAELESTKDKK